uniref:Protein DEPP1 n=1 Tax=Geotrypetes seraphini TaxID=260995 RepID=A0A6P8QLB2_GEOSA|nr:protein DEPP1 [Geotrypetes seraphini]
MRSKLLMSVSSLPTICEYVEEATEDRTQEKEEKSTQTRSPQALDEYAKSIQQLAQPTSLSDSALCSHYSVQNRPQRRLKHKHMSSLQNQDNKALPSIHGAALQDFNMQLPSQPSETAFLNSNDPLNLLYGHNEKNTNKENGPLTRMPAHFHYPQSTTATCHPVSVMQPQKQTEMGKKGLKWGVRYSDAKACRGTVQKPEHFTEVLGKRRASQRLHKTYSYSSNSRGRLNRSQNQHLPVIYEL